MTKTPTNPVPVESELRYGNATHAYRRLSNQRRLAQIGIPFALLRNLAPFCGLMSFCPRPFRVVLFAITCAVLSLNSSASAAEITYRTDEEKIKIVEKGLAPWKSVKRWIIVYDVLAEASQRSTRSVRKTRAVSDTGDYHDHAAHHSKGVPLESDPFTQEVIINNGNYIHRWPFNRTYDERRAIESDYSATRHEDAYSIAVPSWPIGRKAGRTEEYEPIGEFRPLLVQKLLSPDCRLVRGTKTILGEEALVFEVGDKETLALNPSKALCLMEREVRTANVTVRLTAQKIAEVASGLWIPVILRREYMPVSGSGKEKAVIRVLRLDVNDKVEEGAFRIVHSAGSIRFHGDREFEQTSPNGLDLLRQTAQFASKYGDAPPQSGVPCTELARVALSLLVGAGLALAITRRTTKAAREK